MPEKSFGIRKFARDKDRRERERERGYKRKRNTFMFLLMLSSHLLGKYNKCMMLSLRVGQLSLKIHAVITSGREGRRRERERNYS